VVTCTPPMAGCTEAGKTKIVCEPCILYCYPGRGGELPEMACDRINSRSFFNLFLKLALFPFLFNIRDLCEQNHFYSFFRLFFTTLQPVLCSLFCLCFSQLKAVQFSIIIPLLVAIFSVPHNLPLHSASNHLSVLAPFFVNDRISHSTPFICSNF
jgi:hypothetical protein